MAKQQRMSRKDVLNQPDPSEIFAMRMSMAIDWVKANLQYLAYGALGVVVLVAIMIAWTSWQGHRREQASILLHQALKLVDDEQTKDPAKAIEQLQVITQKYGRTPAGAQAYWHLGHQYYDRGDMAEALKAYEVAKRRMPSRQSLSSTLAILNMGYAQESTDACDEAITSYESVQQSPVQWLHGEAYLGMGRCHEKAGATDQAINVYDRALADVNVTANIQQTIRERLALLQPAAPETPATPAPESRDVEPSGTSGTETGDPEKTTEAEKPAEAAQMAEPDKSAAPEKSSAPEKSAAEDVKLDQPEAASEETKNP